MGLSKQAGQFSGMTGRPSRSANARSSLSLAYTNGLHSSTRTSFRPNLARCKVKYALFYQVVRILCHLGVRHELNLSHP